MEPKNQSNYYNPAGANYFQHLIWIFWEDIKKRWQEYTEELYQKDLHDPVNHDGVIIHLEPDILECEIITTNKASGGEFQLSYFKS